MAHVLNPPGITQAWDTVELTPGVNPLAAKAIAAATASRGASATDGSGTARLVGNGSSTAGQPCSEAERNAWAAWFSAFAADPWGAGLGRASGASRPSAEWFGLLGEGLFGEL